MLSSPETKSDFFQIRFPIFVKVTKKIRNLNELKKQQSVLTENNWEIISLQGNENLIKKIKI